MKRLAQLLGLALLTACLSTTLAMPSHAGMLSTTEVLADLDGQADRETLQEFLNRDEVQDELQTMGVPALQARNRVDALTPAEAASLAQRIDALPAAGALSGSDVIIILLVAILVVLIL
ncbi:PA2779 family protein [Pseudomonas benzenivorans]|uniref:PA2779 family protein n=1 Tax=Pseudomonas benzenivorans TaxID=556533 RepID=A0ABY5H845_9PSED|nr:PA2779 family protein [Pseudomonas benzenivorans]UTW07460.1 PA2779 family protein [Pseudomonas benzenivorans]